MDEQRPAASCLQFASVNKQQYGLESGEGFMEGLAVGDEAGEIDSDKEGDVPENDELQVGVGGEIGVVEQWQR